MKNCSIRTGRRWLRFGVVKRGKHLRAKDWRMRVVNYDLRNRYRPGRAANPKSMEAA